mgnify:CR=1 FL=1
MKKSAEANILEFLKENPSVVAAAELQRMSFRNRNGTLASPKAISRRLQELAEQGILDVTYDHKNHAHYSIKEEHRKKEQTVTQVTLPDGTRGVRVTYA